MKTVMIIMLMLIGMIGMAQEPEVIVIGGQTWMAKNVNTGVQIDSKEAKNLDNGTVYKWCYNDMESNCDLYGGLYTWDMAMAYGNNGAQGICPDGFRVPTDADFIQLFEYCGINAGSKLKANSPVRVHSLWEMYQGTNVYAIRNWMQNPTKDIGTWEMRKTQKDENNKSVVNLDTYGFSLLAAGFLTHDGFGFQGIATNLWTATQLATDVAINAKTHNATNGMILQSTGAYKSYGLSLRCIKN